MPVIDLGRVIGPQGPQGAQGAQGQRGEQGFPGPNIVGGDTATTLTGVLVGNGNVVGTRAIDAAPTANSTGFATSGGTKEALDAKANQSQLADVETGTTASRAYDEGECFCWNGLLYRAKTAISSGASFTVGTNCEQTTVNAELFSKCRILSVVVPAGKSVDIVITGNNYAPYHSFLLVSTGNSGTVMGAWLCYGIGTRQAYHLIVPFHTSGGGSIALSSADGKYVFTNNSTTTSVIVNAAIIQEVNGVLSLSSVY